MRIMHACRVAWLAAWASAVGLACGLQAAFACESAADCIDGGVAGTCESTGFCSFPDDACDSGQRYGKHAGGGLGDSCVEPAGESGGTSDASSTSASTS